MLKQIVRATAVLAVVAASAVAQDDMRPTVAVLPFVNSAIGLSNVELAPLSKGIADLLIVELAQNPAIRVVERENILKLIAEQDLARDGRIDDATAARICNRTNDRASSSSDNWVRGFLRHRRDIFLSRIFLSAP